MVVLRSMLLPNREGYHMASSTTVFDSRFGQTYAPASPSLRWGKREILVRRDCRTRFYRVNRFIDCRAGVEAGH